MYDNKLHRMAVLLLTFLPMACGGSESAEAPTDEVPAAEVAKAAPDLSEAGAVSGKVSFEGEQPRRVRIRMGAEPQCEQKHSSAVYSQEVEINENGTLKNAFVWVKEGLEKYSFDPPAEPVLLNQDGCVYEPHVFGVHIGQEIKIVNSDPVTHNIHPVPRNNREWNISQSPAQEFTRSFPRQEVMVPVKCNVHPWMKTYIGVVSHPYFAATGEDGTFELKDLPPGEYTIEVWHEKFGAQEQKITVGPKESKELEFSYKG